ncbi:MAG: histidinol-phosphate transaminase [Spirochaetales bacterium]|nr:histidinol-phosphate transaminase [Spirochaetales bacterium]|tara:strand:- start:19 stop:1101 length:1083 start_codon:yes stop_codon:yes gene_type:complete
MIRPTTQTKKLPVYVPGKPIEELQRELGVERVVKLASNENPLGPSKKVIEKVKNLANHVALYPDGNCFYLKRQISIHENVLPNELIVGNGSNEVLELIAHTYLEREDEAIMGEYCFIVYPIVTTLSQANIVRSKMPEMTHDLDDILSKITARTKIIFIANPNNPTGTKIPTNDLRKFIQEVPKNILVVIDEAYYQYMKPEDRLVSSNEIRENSNLVILKTFSKAYGLAGLRIGYGIGNKTIIDFLNRSREPFNVNSLAQAAAIEALNDQKHVRKSVDLNQSGMIYLKSELNKIPIKSYPSYANFLLLEFKFKGRTIYEELLKRGVITRPVDNYGLENYLRVTIGTEEENKIFINSLKEII